MDSEYAELIKTRQPERFRLLTSCFLLEPATRLATSSPASSILVQSRSISQHMAVYNVLAAAVKTSTEPRFSVLATRIWIAAFDMMKHIQEFIDNFGDTVIDALLS